jgi:hypothetical protein
MVCCVTPTFVTVQGRPADHQFTVLRKLTDSGDQIRMPVASLEVKQSRGGAVTASW